jgi:tetratricopeptide (TPR) repeat protein
MKLLCKSAISLIFLLFLAIHAFSQADSEEYRKTLEMADGYFAKGDYINAKASYQIAIRMAPDEQYPKDRLQQTLGLIKVQMQQNALYSDKIMVADDLYKQKDYSGAIAAYNAALEFLPGDTYATGRISEIEKTMADATQKELDYKKSIADGDKLYTDGKLDASLAEYKKAATLKPDETYPKQKIAEIEKILSDQKQVAGSYEKAMADADIAIQKRKYDEAIVQLENAIKLKPDEALPKQKLADVQKLKTESESYSSVIATADNDYINKDFEKAKAGYQKALTIKPDDEYPKSMLDKIDIAMMDISKANRSSYEVAISEADKYYNEQDYAKAMEAYKNAQRFQPDATYAQQRISDINGMLNLIKSQDEAYVQNISKADELFKEERYDEAKAEYQQASILKPTETYPKVKVDEINTIQANLQNQRQIYSSLITGADKLFFSDDYEEAREQYRKASDLFPKEQYPLDQIKMINEILGRRDTYTKAVTTADQLLYNKKYDEALAEYRKAAALDEKEVYPQGKIYEIETIIAEQEKEKTQQRQYDSVLVIADDQFEKGDYVHAMESYKTAQAISPAQGYPKRKLDEINRINQEATAREAFEKQYSDAIIQADQLLASKDYDGAIKAYEAALQLKPGEQYPKDKIAGINAEKDAIVKQQLLDKQYSDAIASADKFMAAKDYQNALTSYQTALNLKPGEQYPAQKAAEATSAMGELEAARAALEKQYNDAIAKGDQSMAAGDYDNAIASYEAASKVKPSENYPVDQIKEAGLKKQEAAAQQALDKQYNEAIAKADKLLAAKDYQNALTAYNEAADLKPTEKYPADKIMEINATVNQIAAQEALDKQYNDDIARADKMLADKDYQGALLTYQAAAALKPAEKYPASKIEEINNTVKDIAAAKEALDKQYSDAIFNADKLLASKDYQGAMNAYNAALKLKPAESYPQSKITEINGTLQEIAAKEAIDKQYSEAIAKADKLLAAKDYTNALAAYEAAAVINPGESYPASKITEIQATMDQIAAQQALDKQYTEAIAAADKFLAVKDYQNALTAYQSAAALKPGESYPGTKIAEIHGILDAIAAKEALDKQYNETVANADKLFAAKDYQGALKEYQAALVLKPGEKYPADQVTAVNGILGEMAAKEALEKQFAQLTSEAAALEGQQQYAEAKKKYEAALALKPGDPTITSKITALDATMAEIAKKAEEDKKYNDAIAFGDKHMAAKDYENARKEYQLASSIKTNEPYPQQKLTEIDSIEEGIRKQKELDDQYNKAIASADGFFKQEKYEEARASYQEAQKLKPAEDYPQKQIIDINNRLVVQAQERDQAYQVAITKADNYLEQQDYAMAKVQYERATELKPNEVYPLDKLKLVNEEIMKQRQVIQEEYDKAIADADKYYASKLYDNAIESYKASSLLKPDEDYPKEMVRRILKMLSERSIVQINKDPLLIPNNTTHKFEFLPVPVKDRKSNYIYFTARNTSEKEYKLIINFGKDQVKNGGVVVKVPPGAELNQYIVRISAQYKWFSDDNNWVTFYPEGGDIEVNLLQISYSD